MGFFWELCKRASAEILSAKGTTLLGGVLLPVIGIGLQFAIKLCRQGKKAVNKEEAIAGALATGLIWLMLFSFYLVWKVPKEIRDEADRQIAVKLPELRPPLNWDAGRGQPPKLPPETIHSLVTVARITCERAPEVEAPSSEMGFSLLSGDTAATLTDKDESRVILRTVPPIAREIHPTTVDVIERFVLDPGLRPEGENVESWKRFKSMSVVMLGWGFGPWCARPTRADISLLVNGRSVWNKIKPIDAKSKLDFSLP